MDVRADGVVEPLPAQRLLLSDGTLDLRGTRLAGDFPKGVSVWNIAPPASTVTRVTGLYPNDNWSGRVVVYKRRGCTGGTVSVSLRGDPSLFHEEQKVRANDSTFVVTPGVPTVATVPLRECTARFLVSPTKVPGGADPRHLGLRFLSFAYLRQ
jgi:hypothetical protein